MWLVPFVVSLICGLYLARAFTTSKAFSRSSLCRLWLLLCTLNKIMLLWCHIPWKLQIFPNSKKGFPPYSSQSSPPGFILLVIFWPHFCVEALGFLIALVFFVLIYFPGLKCRLIISLAFYFDFLSIREMYLRRSAYTYTVFVSLGHLVKGRRQIAVAESELFSKVASTVLP